MNYLPLEFSMLYFQTAVDHGEAKLPRPKPWLREITGLSFEYIISLSLFFFLSFVIL